MGLKDLLKKALTGASDEDNRKNKAKMREIFNSLVADGDAYTLIYCHMENSHNAVVVEVNVHSNYIVGYKPGEVVIVPVNGQLTEWGEAEVFNKGERRSDCFQLDRLLLGVQGGRSFSA